MRQESPSQNEGFTATRPRRQRSDTLRVVIAAVCCSFKLTVLAFITVPMLVERFFERRIWETRQVVRYGQYSCRRCRCYRRETARPESQQPDADQFVQHLNHGQPVVVLLQSIRDRTWSLRNRRPTRLFQQPISGLQGQRIRPCQIQSLSPQAYNTNCNVRPLLT